MSIPTGVRVHLTPVSRPCSRCDRDTVPPVAVEVRWGRARGSLSGLNSAHFWPHEGRRHPLSPVGRGASCQWRRERTRTLRSLQRMLRDRVFLLATLATSRDVVYDDHHV